MSQAVISRHEAATGTMTAYVIGFISSVVLTLAAFFLIREEVLSGWGAVATISGLALLQLLVQLVCFLHLGRESKPRWNLQVMLFAIMIVGIVAGGSLWIMKNLNYHHGHSTPAEASDRFLIKDEGYQPRP